VKRYLPLAGLAGPFLLAFGLVAYFATGDLADLYVLAHLGLGTVLIVGFALARGRDLLASLKRRATYQGAHALLYSALFVGVLVVINFLAARYPHRWDLTENRVFSLSSQSLQVLGQLRQDLEIWGFFERGENPRALDLIRTYAYHSPRIKFQVVDPERHPELAKRFKIQQPNTLHLRYGKEATNLTDINEESVTNAIIRLAKATKKNIYFLTGHGEPKLHDRESAEGYAAALDALENENYQVHELLLASQDRVPDGASLVIVAGPQKALLEHELKALDAYLKKGGRLLVLLPSTGGDGLKSYLREWGVEVGDDLVVDQVVRLFAGPALGVEPIAETYSPSHPITQGFSERTLFPMVRSVEPGKTPRDGFEVASLVMTGETSWAERDVEAIFKQGRASLGPGDKKGPVSVAVAVSPAKPGSAAEPKLVVLGTAAFANNRFLNIFFNRDFFLNTVNWLVGQEEMISIRPRSLRSSRIHLTEGESRAVFYLSFLILPELLVILGLAVWWRRR
jgi:ABC-type uncharacterized transport system involved in gliding motility auxiliary subunit